MYDFNVIAVLQQMLRMPPARHDFAVDLDGDAALGQVVLLQQRGEGAGFWKRQRVAIEHDVHAAIVAHVPEAHVFAVPYT